MSQVLRPPKPVKLIVGMLTGAARLFDLAEASMVELWGPIAERSDVMDFEQTHYYEKEMGPNLLRKFVGFTELIDPGQLAQIKHQSNALEAFYAEQPDGQALGVARPINLDPGYVESSKLVLATTKNYSHRIYIGQSMYAEATLYYSKSQWHAWPYTYPDYAGGAYDVFFNRVRASLMEQSKSQN